MIRASRRLAAIPLCFGRLSTTYLPRDKPISYTQSQHHRLVNFVGSTNRVCYNYIVDSTNTCSRAVYDYTTTRILSMTSASPWEDESASITKKGIAQLIQGLCIACYWRTDAGETHGCFSVSDLSVVDGTLSIPSSKNGDRLLSDSFKDTIKDIFLGHHLTSQEFSDFMERVSKILSKEDYKRIYLHTLLKDKEGRINFVSSSVDRLRGFPPLQNPRGFNWVVEYDKMFQRTEDILAQLKTIETTNHYYDTFKDIYNFGWRRYSKNNAPAAAIYIRNALRHFNQTRSMNGWPGYESAQWVANKLHDLFSGSPLEMYCFLVKFDGKHDIKLDVNDEFRGIPNGE